MSNPSGDRGATISTRWVELVVALLIVIGGGIVVFDSIRLGAAWGDDGPQSGYVPHLVGWALALAGLWIAGSALWRWKRHAESVFVEVSALKPVLTMLLPTVAYIVVMNWLGLYVASAIYITAFMLWQGKYRLVPSLAVGIGVPVAAFLLFEIWFLVPLPKGPLEHLLGY